MKYKGVTPVTNVTTQVREAEAIIQRPAKPETPLQLLSICI